jgi:hypothetical protein
VRKRVPRCQGEAFSVHFGSPRAGAIVEFSRLLLTEAPLLAEQTGIKSGRGSQLRLKS